MCLWTIFLADIPICSPSRMDAHTGIFTHIHPHTSLNRKQLTLWDKQTKLSKNYRIKKIAFWKVLYNKNHKELPSHSFRWRTVLWFSTFFCPCPSLAASNGALLGRGWHHSVVSNRATQVCIWPPALLFFSLLRVLIITPMCMIWKIQPFSITAACTLFLHIYSWSINFINVLPPNYNTKLQQHCTMYSRVKRSTE